MKVLVVGKQSSNDLVKYMLTDLGVEYVETTDYREAVAMLYKDGDIKTLITGFYYTTYAEASIAPLDEDLQMNGVNMCAFAKVANSEVKTILMSTLRPDCLLMAIELEIVDEFILKTDVMTTLKLLKKSL